MKTAAILTAAFLVAAAHAQTIQVDSNNRTLAVTATDTVKAEADIAVLYIGFESSAPDAATAYAQGSRLSNAIVEALRKAGVPDTSIESREQNLARTAFPYDDHSTPEQRAQRAFTLSQSWSVHTSANDAAGVLHAAVEAGANQSGNIDWEVSDRDTLEAKAAAKALVHARAIAAQMAAGLSAHLGPLLYASNQAPEVPIRPMRAAAIGTGQGGGNGPAALAILPQQVQQSATVYAIFSIQ